MRQAGPWLVFCLGVAIIGAGCAVPPPRQSPVSDASLRERTARIFSHANYFKPAAGVSQAATNFLAFAPLFLVESATTQPPTHSPQLKVFCHRSQFRFGGKTYSQFAYWMAPLKAQSSRGTSISRQGVRVTLDSRGRPAIWEILADSSGARLIFVSQALETAARREFGPPGAGNLSALERPPGTADRTVMPRIIDDGPVPMGPIVYLAAANQDVTTVACRCMDAQARELTGTYEYQLAPTRRTAFQHCQLDRWLRLPTNF